MTPSTSELPSSTTLSSSSLKSNTLLSSSSTSSLLNSFKESESLGWTPSTSHFELRCETERLLRAQNIELPTHSKKRSVTEFLENRKKTKINPVLTLPVPDDTLLTLSDSDNESTVISHPHSRSLQEHQKTLRLKMIQQAQRKQKTLPNLMAKNWTDIELQKNNDLNEKSNDEAVESLDELSIDSEEDYEEGDDDDEDDDEEEEDDDDEEEEDDDDEEENDEDEAEEEGGEEEEELMNKVDDWMSESQRTPEDVGKLENTIMKDRETPSYHSNPVVASKVIQLDYSSTHATFQSEISSSIHSSVSITSIDSPSPDSTHHRSLRRKNRIHSPHSLPSSPTFPSNEQSDRFLMLPSSPEPSSSTSKFRRLRRTSGLLHTSSSSSSNSMKPSSPKETVPSFTSDYRSTVGQFFDDEAEESEDDAFIRSDVDPDEDENKAEEEEEEGEEDRDLEGFVLPDDAGEDEEEQGEKRLKNSDSVRALYAKQEQEDSKAFLEQLDRSLRPSLSTSVRMLNQRTTDAFPQRSMMPSWTTPLDDFTVDSSLKPVILNPSLSTSTLSLSSTTHFSSSSPPLPTSVITRLRPPSLPMTRTTFRGKSFDPRNNLAHSEDASMAPLGLKIDGSSYHPTPVPIAGTSFTSSVTLGESNLLNVLEENKKG